LIPVHALLLSARKLRCAEIEPVGEPHALEQRPRARRRGKRLDAPRRGMVRLPLETELAVSTNAMLAYRRQNATSSLAEGLAEYYREHPFLKRGSDLAAEAREFFRCHDAVHVLYGCDTSLSDEAIVKLSSIFGTTGGFGVLKGYALYDSIDIYRQLKLKDVLATLLRAFVIVPRSLWRCFRQSERWPWSTFDQHLQTPLCALRRRFGIRVAETTTRD
jgi:hypothetical protein